MITRTVLRVLNNCNKPNFELYDTVKLYYGGEEKIYDCNINIIYLLGNKIYIGKGSITEYKKNIHSKLRHIGKYNKKQIQYTYRPKYIDTISNKEIPIFKKLIQHSQESWTNLRLSTSYSEFILNHIPYLLSVYNEYAYSKYEVRNITYATDMKHINVNLFIDNCDIEQHENFLLPYSSEIMEDLASIGDYEGSRNIWYENPHLIKI